MIVVNPIMGGGLSNAKLALADAVAANVLSGKKFYSGDKVLKTGALSLAATATPADVVSGKTFFAGSTTKKTGTRSSGTIQKVSGSFPALDANSTTKNSHTITLPMSPELIIFYSNDSSGFRYGSSFYCASHYRYLESRAGDVLRDIQGSNARQLKVQDKTITFTEYVYGKGTLGGEYTLHLFDLGTVYYIAYG